MGWPDGSKPNACVRPLFRRVTLFELATLQPPFTGSRDELRHAHRYTEPPSPRELRDDIPPALERLILQLLRKTPNERGASASEALQLLDLLPSQEDSTGASTSEVITRLQEGASSLMLRAAEREAESARRQQEREEEAELVEQAVTKLDDIVEAAREIVARNVAPLEVRALGGRSFALQESARTLSIDFGPVREASVFLGANAPGRIVSFGDVSIKEEHRTLGGANLIAFVGDDAPWVINLQEIQLRNMALVSTPMRDYELFFLTDGELGEHAKWLWGGAMHVYTAEHRELTVEALTKWFALLIP